MKKLFSIILTLIITLSMLVIPIQSYGATLTSQAGVVSVSSGGLNIRKTASTGSSVLTTLPKGSYVTLISTSGNWYYVEYADGKYGYCHKSYIKPDSGKTATVTVDV